MSPRVLLLVPFLTLLGGQLQAAETQRPNVIFILTDDQGWADAKFAGHPYVQTPNLDRLASQGTWFKQFYVAATVCSPSRCAFLTSYYPARHHIHGHFADHALNQTRSMPDWLDPQTVTVTQLLREAGYATGHFGKRHLGGGDGAPTPDAYGIDDVRALVCRNPAWTEPATPFWAKSSARIVDEAIRFIQANQDRPLYANVWTLLPHAPLNPTPEQLQVYESLVPRADDPAFGKWMQSYLGEAKDLNSQMRVFCASLTDLDTQIGRLLRPRPNPLRRTSRPWIVPPASGPRTRTTTASSAWRSISTTSPTKPKVAAVSPHSTRTRTAC